MFGIVEFQDEEENEPLRYTPMYTFYNWEQLTPTMFLSQASLNHTEEHHDVNNDTNTLQVKPRLWLKDIAAHGHGYGLGLGRNREQGPKSEPVQCEHVLHGTMLPSGLQSESKSESIPVTESGYVIRPKHEPSTCPFFLKLGSMQLYAYT